MCIVVGGRQLVSFYCWIALFIFYFFYLNATFLHTVLCWRSGSAPAPPMRDWGSSRIRIRGLNGLSFVKWLGGWVSLHECVMSLLTLAASWRSSNKCIQSGLDMPIMSHVESSSRVWSSAFIWSKFHCVFIRYFYFRWNDTVNKGRKCILNKLVGLCIALKLQPGGGRLCLS